MSSSAFPTIRSAPPPPMSQSWPPAEVVFVLNAHADFAGIGAADDLDAIAARRPADHELDIGGKILKLILKSRHSTKCNFPVLTWSLDFVDVILVLVLEHFGHGGALTRGATASYSTPELNLSGSLQVSDSREPAVNQPGHAGLSGVQAAHSIVRQMRLKSWGAYAAEWWDMWQRIRRPYRSHF